VNGDNGNDVENGTEKGICGCYKDNDSPNGELQSRRKVKKGKGRRKLKRRDNRKLKRFRQPRRDSSCDDYVDLPILTSGSRHRVFRSTPNVDLECSANNFVAENANNIKQQSADNLNKVQNLLRGGRC